MTDRIYPLALSPKKMALCQWLLVFLSSVCLLSSSRDASLALLLLTGAGGGGVSPESSNNNPQFPSRAHSFWSQTMNFWCCHFSGPKRNHNMQPVWLLKSLGVKHRKGSWCASCVTQHHSWMRREWEHLGIITILALPPPPTPPQVSIEYLIKSFAFI